MPAKANFVPTIPPIPKVGGEPRQSLAAVLWERSIALLQRLILEAPPDVLRHALAAPTDVGGMATLLSDLAPLGIDIDALDPLAEAIARGAAEKERLLADLGGALSSAMVAQALGITRQAVDKRRQTQSLLAVPSGRGDFLYPKCQFTASGVIPGLEQVLRAFSVNDPWIQLAVLTSPAPSLGGRTCIDTLKAGDVEGAMRVARTYGEHGA